MTGENQENTSQDLSQLLGLDTEELQNTWGSELEVVTPWHRGGAETYVCDFLLTKEGQSQHLIAKACIKFGPREAMGEWLQRRGKLHNNGVGLPDLYLVEGATIVEEYIPYGFAEAFGLATDAERAGLKNAYIDMYKRIVGAGFFPMSLHDVRSRGHDAVVIDVGEDLGPFKAIDGNSLSVIVAAEKSFRTATS